MSSSELPRCFLSYRRDDSAGHAGRLYDRLRERFGPDRVFMDVGDIAPGLDFVTAIGSALSQADVVVAVMGRGWSGAADASGARRLDDPRDFVRLELATAFERGLPVLPVLVQGAVMPAADLLPEAVRPLARRNALSVHDDAWEAGVEALLAAIVDLAAEPGGPAADLGSATRRARRTITVVAALVDAEPLAGGELDPEVLPGIEARGVEAVIEALRRHGGSVHDAPGGGVLGFFGVPAAHEDDPIRALRAAKEARDAVGIAADDLRDRGVGLAVRLGVRTGLVVASAPQHGVPVQGEAVRDAQRLAEVAAAGEIRVDTATLEPIPGRAEVEATEEAGVSRLLRLDADAPLRRHEAPMVGRAEELAALRGAFRRVIQERAPGLVTLTGDPGVGKSRLLMAFVASLGGDARVLQGRCLSYGEGVTFWPVAEAIRRGLAVDDRASAADVRSALARALGEATDAERVVPVVAQLLGVGTGAAFPADELFWAVRRFLETLARERPLVLVVDDIHWAEPGLLDMLDHVVTRAADAPMLVVCPARPEMLEAHPGWGSALANATVIRLFPLGLDEVGELAGELLDGAQVPAPLAERLLEIAGGNPLFLEEVVASLREDGALRLEGDRWDLVGEVKVPSAIQGLLATRLDRLAGEERNVLERASVVGQEFSIAEVDELTPEAERPEVGPALASLTRRDLVRPAAGDDTYRFRHLLIRDAAYETLPKRERADLHAMLGGRMERLAGERLPEVEEIVGYHLERAVAYRRELALDAGDLPPRAAAHLEAAGRRALERSDMPAAANLLGRASALRPEGGRERLVLDLDRAEVLHELGEISQSIELLSGALPRAEAIADPSLVARAQLGLAFAQAFEGLVPDDEILGAVDRAIAVFRDAGDQPGLARGHRIAAAVRWWQPDFPAAVRSLTEALRLARAAGDAREEEAILSWLAHAWLWDDTPAGRGLANVRAIVADPPSRRALGKSLQAEAGLLAMTGDDEGALAALVRADAVLADVGMDLAQAVGAQVTATVHLLAGRPERAETAVQTALDRLEAIGEQGYLATMLSFLAKSALGAGHVEEARAAVERAASFADADDPVDRADWAATAALLQSLDGVHDGAERTASEAVDVFEAAGMRFDQAQALLALADVRLARGDTTGARAAAVRARDAFGAKEVLAGVRWSTQRLEAAD